MTCRGWIYKVVVIVAVYTISLYIMYTTVPRLALPWGPGFEAIILVVFHHSILLIATLASMTLILYTTGGLLATAAPPLGLLFLALQSPYKLSLLANLSISLSLVALLALILQIRGRLGEPLLDITLNPRISPTALASAALTLYISWGLIASSNVPCEAQLLYTITSIIAALIASLASSSLLESIATGALAGLGPLGLGVNTVYAAFKPIRPPQCEGVEIGELIGLTTTASPTRAMVQARTGPRGNYVVCCQRSKARLELREPWIIWIYGSEAQDLASRIAEELGGGLILKFGAPGPKLTELDLGEGLLKLPENTLVELGLGGIEPVELRLTMAPTIAETASKAKTLILDIDIQLDQESLLRLAYDITRKHPRVIILFHEIPWKERILAPKGSAKNSAFIITKLPDPIQAGNIAETLLPKQAEGIKEALMKGGIALAYPGCGGKIIAIS